MHGRFLSCMTITSASRMFLSGWKLDDTSACFSFYLHWSKVETSSKLCHVWRYFSHLVFIVLEFEDPNVSYLFSCTIFKLLFHICMRHHNAGFVACNMQRARGWMFSKVMLVFLSFLLLHWQFHFLLLWSRFKYLEVRLVREVAGNVAWKRLMEVSAAHSKHHGNG